MRKDQFPRSGDGWTRFAAKVESAFRLPNGRGGQLVRPRFPRKLAGVCSGLAQHFGWNVTLLRVLLVLLTVASTGCMVLAYAAAWVLIPDGQYTLPGSTTGGAGTPRS